MAKTRTIAESSKELTARERVALKHPENTVAVNELLEREGEFTFTPSWYASVKIEDPEAPEDERVRFTYLLAADDGTLYGTGSESLMTAFLDIFKEMDGSGEEYEIRVYKTRSKNGRNYTTCSLV